MSSIPQIEEEINMKKVLLIALVIGMALGFAGGVMAGLEIGIQMAPERLVVITSTPIPPGLWRVLPMPTAIPSVTF